MDACTIFCSLCIEEIRPGSGVALSCQCFLCTNCSAGAPSFRRCPVCNTSEPEKVSLAPKEIPDEIKNLLGNPKRVLDDVNDIVSFHCGHYRSTIKLAQAKIAHLTELLNAAQGDLRRYEAFTYAI